MDAPIALIIAAALLGLYTSAATATSITALWQLVLGVAFYYCLAFGLRRDSQRRVLIPALLAGCFAVSMLTLFGTHWAIVRLASWPQLYDHLPILFQAPDGSGRFHPRIMGMALATLFPIPVALLVFDTDRRWRMVSAGLILLMACLMLLTQSLQALMGVGAALFVLGVWRSRWFLLAVPLGAALLCWGVAAYGAVPLANRLLSFDDLFGLGIVLRLDMWGRAIEMLADMPFTGIGLNSFPLIQTNFYPGFGIGPELHAHNLFLQAALDLGLFGLAALIWLLVAFTIAAAAALRHSSGQARALLIGLGLAMVAYVAGQMIETYWETWLNLIFWMILGATTGIARMSSLSVDPKSRPQPASRVIRALPWLLPPALIALCLLVAPYAWQRNLAIMDAHKLLSQPGASSDMPPANAPASTIQGLRAAQAFAADNVQIYALLGSLYARQGDYPAASEALERRVALDLRDPMGRYAPFEALRRELVGETAHSPPDDLIRVYLQWVQRFPGRAETYVQVAAVRSRYLGDMKSAAATVRSGQQRGAQPAGLLAYYLASTVSAGAEPALGVRPTQPPPHPGR
jgi:putative inorganic carbon (HCO3(-)) transporter